MNYNNEFVNFDEYLLKFHHETVYSLFGFHYVYEFTAEIISIYKINSWYNAKLDSWNKIKKLHCHNIPVNNLFCI